MAPDKKRITVSLTQDAIDKLKELADQRGITATAVLNQAIATEDFLAKESKDGKVLIRKNDGTTKEVIFR
ncbi:MAG: ribbon-helix-helix protein, CopG family [Nostoc sp. DedVER02]|uniref:ribbon-helix-helix protein, CopG family n=1 Tax=unclassified Nostoc TaxID=2593658 RepID=UPI002AD44E05|nr:MULTISPECIES: ribbon-helix-helix protein, CopG family [unclassified Nostoc]MDZ7987569.1 ribbon-helix-helix protein, CopG family [Nostoc sp. DedVER02]MDZ8116342.1 ribbon-helix-helix protein, CopG family [Nostoc sp. DedVER01b]